jgi:hypothetical protein
LNDFVDTLQQILIENIYLILFFVALVISLFYLLRHFPDKANLIFWQAGIRAGNKANEHRNDLGDIIAQQSMNSQKAVADQASRIQGINFQRERIERLVHTHPKLVKEVGLALIAVEREYLKKLKVLKSDQAKEALRLATQQRISGILDSLELPKSNLPKFKI